MTLILDLPSNIDEQLRRDAEQKGVAKETLAIDMITRSVGTAGAGQDATSAFWSPASYESLAREQGVEPVVDFEKWFASLPTIDGADELVERVAEARRERREMEKARW